MKDSEYCIDEFKKLQKKLVEEKDLMIVAVNIPTWDVVEASDEMRKFLGIKRKEKDVVS